MRNEIVQVIQSSLHGLVSKRLLDWYGDSISPFNVTTGEWNGFKQSINQVEEMDKCSDSTNLKIWFNETLNTSLAIDNNDVEVYSKVVYNNILIYILQDIIIILLHVEM